MRIAYIGGTLTRANGGWSLSRELAILVERVAAGCQEIALCSIVAHEGDTLFYRGGHSIYTHELNVKNARIVAVRTPRPGQSPWSKALTAFARVGPYARCIRWASFVLIGMPSFSGWLASLICRLLRKPYGLYFASDWQEVAPFVSAWGDEPGTAYRSYLAFSRWAERSSVVHARFVRVAGRALFDKFRPFNDRVVETVPLVSIARSDWHERTDTCQRAEIRLLYVGQLISRKGVHLIVDAVERLRAQGRQVELELVGAGDRDYEQSLRARVESLGLSDRVRFHGYVEDVSQLLDRYRAADIFVIASLGEGFPRVIYEAMMQGLPVVASDIGTVRAMLGHREEAVLFTPGSVPALVDAVEVVIRDADLRQGLIRRGYTFARVHVGAEHTGTQVATLIQQYGGTESRSR